VKVDSADVELVLLLVELAIAVVLEEVVVSIAEDVISVDDVVDDGVVIISLVVEELDGAAVVDAEVVAMDSDVVAIEADVVLERDDAAVEEEELDLAELDVVVLLFDPELERRTYAPPATAIITTRITTATIAPIPDLLICKPNGLGWRVYKRFWSNRHSICAAFFQSMRAPKIPKYSFRSATLWALRVV
jgi:hypothetical protein